ncbi:hypothetical protein D9756_006208 [Leucocoprinus leucothites]|uniref:Uncharacterized protein n=1 Tax=Leucocoprinus leucothites TaxID=201217 RepID=A0A8H5FXP7_9AGAR|nr:hypothetical protein D9756_006208 [Leucoagaricus leucothites]
MASYSGELRRDPYPIVASNINERTPHQAKQQLGQTIPAQRDWRKPQHGVNTTGDKSTFLIVSDSHLLSPSTRIIGPLHGQFLPSFLYYNRGSGHMTSPVFLQSLLRDPNLLHSSAQTSA